MIGKHGNVVVVGAGSGIGRAIARRFAGEGDRVACLSLHEAAAAATAASLTGEDHFSLGIDVRDERSVAEALAEVEARFGRIDALVNSAGIGGVQNRQAHLVDPADFDEVYRVNLRGAFLLSADVIPRMLPHGYGRVLHVASMAGKDGNTGMVAYTASKAAVIGMVKTIGKEYATTGITVNAIAPTVIVTPLVEAQEPAQIEALIGRIPMGRPGTLDEIAALASWIASPECSFTTGFCFDLSGGRAVY
jgi:2-dehydro-3-deoxy-L-rhamnonate dehydrogenase (NAD+)